MFRTAFFRSFVGASVFVGVALQPGCLALLPNAGPTQQQMLDSMRSTMFVSSSDAWLCPTAEAALAKQACEGGRRVLHNRSITVLGQDSKAGVWPSPDDTSVPARTLYVAANQLNGLPILAELSNFEDDLWARYPADKRIESKTFNLTELVLRPRSFAGKYVVLRQKLKTMSAESWDDGIFSFNLSIPLSNTTKYGTPVHFEFRNAAIVDEFLTQQRAYQCSAYCDEFIIVAQLTERFVFVTRSSGVPIRVPVFDIVELADRYGAYRPD